MELKVDRVRKRFGRVEVLKEVSFELRSGQVLLLLGPNASGKSTLLRIISTVSKPDSGGVFLDGVDVVKNPSRMRRILSYVPEVPSLIDELSVDENLRFFSRLFKVKADLEYLKRRFGLESDGRKAVSKISKGMKQRLSLAVSTMRNPEIVVLDEPTSGLDRETIELVLSMISELAGEGKMVLVTSHDEEDLLRVATHVAVLENGVLSVLGSVEDLEDERLVEVCVSGERKRIRMRDVVGDVKIVRVMGIRESVKQQR